MKDVLGFLLVAAVIVGLLVVSYRSRPGNVISRRHERYQRKFAGAKTPADQLRHANAYLDEVAAISEAKTAAVAKEVFALAAKHNAMPVPPTRTVIPVKPN